MGQQPLGLLARRRRDLPDQIQLFAADFRAGTQQQRIKERRRAKRIARGILNR